MPTDEELRRGLGYNTNGPGFTGRDETDRGGSAIGPMGVPVYTDVNRGLNQQAAAMNTGLSRSYSDPRSSEEVARDRAAYETARTTTPEGVRREGIRTYESGTGIRPSDPELAKIYDDYAMGFKKDNYTAFNERLSPRSTAFNRIPAEPYPDRMQRIETAKKEIMEYRRARGLWTPDQGQGISSISNTSPSEVSNAGPFVRTSSHGVDETGKGYSINYPDNSMDIPISPSTTISNMGGNPSGAVYDTQSYNNMPNTLNPRESRGLSTPAVVAQPGARDVELLRRLDQVDTTGALPPGVKSTMGATRSYAEPTSTSTQALAQSTVQPTDPIADRLAEQRQAERGLAAKRAEPFLDPFKRIIFGKPAINPNLTYGLGR
jgi:hypothetical protein